MSKDRWTSVCTESNDSDDGIVCGFRRIKPSPWTARKPWSQIYVTAVVTVTIQGMSFVRRFLRSVSPACVAKFDFYTWSTRSAVSRARRKLKESFGLCHEARLLRTVLRANVWRRILFFEARRKALIRAKARGNAVIRSQLRRANNTLYRSSFRIRFVSNDRRRHISIIIGLRSRPWDYDGQTTPGDDRRFFVTVVSRPTVDESLRIVWWTYVIIVGAVAK